MKLQIWFNTQENWGTAQADRYLLELEACFIELAAHPELGKHRPEIRNGYRSIPKNHHIIFYHQQQNHIEIIRILHQRMDMKPRLKD